MEKIDKKMPRMLVTSVPAWSNSVGSDTFSSLLKNYDREKLACLYIRANKSDSPTCNHYFQILEGRVMKSILNRKTKTGIEYYTEDTNQTSDNSLGKELEAEKRRYGFFRKFRSYLFLFAREFVWKFGKWKSKELDQFLDTFDPEVLFFPIEGYIHFNRINEYIIAKKRPKKVIGFLWDDNFTYKQQPYHIGYLLHRFWLRFSVRRLVKQCDTVFAISPKMKEECDKEFGIDSVLLTKPIHNPKPFKPYTPSSPIRILYTGNLYIQRDQTIALLVDAIRKVNQGETKVFLDIYTSTQLSEKMYRRIHVDGCCQIHGSIPQSEVIEKQKEADILLFVESFSEKNQSARLSFSTKITDYLNSGRCIWAIGNKDLSAIEYLEKENAAFISSNINSIYLTLNQIISKKSLIQTFAKNAFFCGCKNHNEEIIQSKIYSVLWPKN